MQKDILVRVDFGGGLDLVFDGKTEIEVMLPLEGTVKDVIIELENKHANHKKDMFAIKGQM